MTWGGPLDRGRIYQDPLTHRPGDSHRHLPCVMHCQCSRCQSSRCLWSGGLLLWYFTLRSGIHATISGVLLAFALPFRDGGPDSPSYRLQHELHYPVAFGVLPLFAFANTGLHISSNWTEQLMSPNSLGIMLGLCVGKPAGILIATYLCLRLKWGELPPSITARHLVGVAITAGIGFTMSIFITNLAYGTTRLSTSSRIAILVSAVLSSLAGILWFFSC